MANIPGLANLGGTVRRVAVSKRGHETRAERAGRIAAWCIGHAPYFAIRYGGDWHIYPVSGPTPILSGLTEDQATMWLHHRGRKP